MYVDLPTPMTYISPSEVTSPKFGKAFADGCKGKLTNQLVSLQPGSFASFCTPAVWPLLDRAIADQRDYYYGDHAYWGRGHYYRVTHNAVQFQPTLVDLRRARPQRFALLNIAIAADWQQTGVHVVICPNSSVYMRRFGLDAEQWVTDVTSQIRLVSNRPIVVRWKRDARRRPLHLDLTNAHAVVVFSSNAAVEALVAGVPVFVLAPWASTRALACADVAQIETPIYPDDRLPFLWALAEQQWTLAEIATGLAWRSLCNRIDRN